MLQLGEFITCPDDATEMPLAWNKIIAKQDGKMVILSYDDLAAAYLTPGNGVRQMLYFYSTFNVVRHAP